MKPSRKKFCANLVRYEHLLSERHRALGITSLNVEQIGEVCKPPMRQPLRIGGLFCLQHLETTARTSP
nr:MAG TPA: hypothetical protein [Caudoviricetes sp.]DAY14018.1 MAG TPA: hypothetical protein [Caudoviricetes sp.]